GLFLKEMPKPAKGNDLVCIQLTIVKIKNLHVISMGRVYRANVRHQASSKVDLDYQGNIFWDRTYGGNGDEQSFLTDAEGHKYRLNFWQAGGVEFLDFSYLTGSYKFIEGSRCILLFEMPKRKEPANLTFVYYFKEAWEDAFSKKGQIDIKIQ
ncbi:unnamed protein product, partial [marine sediment metagenome]